MTCSPAMSCPDQQGDVIPEASCGMLQTFRKQSRENSATPTTTVTAWRHSQTHSPPDRRASRSTPKSICNRATCGCFFQQLRLAKVANLVYRSRRSKGVSRFITERAYFSRAGKRVGGIGASASHLDEILLTNYATSQLIQPGTPPGLPKSC